MANSAPAATPSNGGSGDTNENLKPYQQSPLAPKNVEEVMSKPITGPAPAGPEYLFEPDLRRPVSTALYIGRNLLDTVRIPAKWIRTNIVEPNKGPKYYYYQRKYPRALPVDECYMDDEACLYEADLEFQRNRKVDRATLKILQFRRDNCYFWHSTNEKTFKPSEACAELAETFEREETNYHMKYGDMHHHASVLFAYNKQKHRMIIDRRRAEMAKEQQGPAEQLPK